MPELPEVETVCRSLRPCLEGRTIAAVECLSPTLRWKLEPGRLRRALVGRRLESVGRRGKYLLFRLDDGSGMVLHLGMTGRCRLVPASEAPALHDRVLWRLDNGLSWRFQDARKFGSVQLCRSLEPRDLPRALQEMGPEPLDDGFDGDVLFEKSRGARRPAKVFILDQAVVAGCGNIYASEALWRARIHPATQAAELTRPQCRRLAQALREVLAEAVAAGGTTIIDYRQPDGSEGEFQVRLAVYGRAGDPCRRCRTPVVRLVLGGRSTFFCPRCQPAPAKGAMRPK